MLLRLSQIDKGVWRWSFIKSFIFRWFKTFHMAGINAQRLLMSRTDNNVDRIRDLVKSNHQLTIKIISEQLNLNLNIVHQIFTNELRIRKVCVNLTQKTWLEQKNNRIIVSHDILGWIKNDPDLIYYVITGDESWIYVYGLK